MPSFKTDISFSDMALAGIVNTLEEKFGIPAYASSSGHGIDAPCFTARLESVASSRVTMGRWRRELKFSVRYYALPAQKAVDSFYCEDSRESAPGLELMGDSMFEALEVVNTADGPVRGGDMRYELKDGALRFFVKYSAILGELDTPGGKMGDFKII